MSKSPEFRASCYAALQQTRKIARGFADVTDKIPKSKYRVTNWHDYNESLRRRGDVTVWVDEDAARQWHARVAGKRGRPVIFSDYAIATCLQEVADSAPKLIS